MNILITGHHLDITPAIRSHVESKLERITRHFDQIIEVDVILGVENPADKDKRQTAEVNLRLKGETLHAQHQAQNLYAAIDGLMDKLDRQVCDVKEKIRDHKHESSKRLEMHAKSDED